MFFGREPTSWIFFFFPVNILLVSTSRFLLGAGKRNFSKLLLPTQSDFFCLGVWRKGKLAHVWVYCRLYPSSDSSEEKIYLDLRFNLLRVRRKARPHQVLCPVIWHKSNLKNSGSSAMERGRIAEFFMKCCTCWVSIAQSLAPVGRVSSFPSSN